MVHDNTRRRTVIGFLDGFLNKMNFSPTDEYDGDYDDMDMTEENEEEEEKEEEIKVKINVLKKI